MNKKRLYLWGGVILAMLIVVVFAVQLADQNGEQQGATAEDVIGAETRSTLQLRSEDWIKGNREADVTLIKYSDFQCPSCANAARLFAQIEEEYEDNIAFVYRHFPLPNMEHSRDAARYAEAAGMQGEFWTMHNMIFNTQRRWSRGEAIEVFDDLADRLDINSEQFYEDLESEEVEQRIQRDFEDARRLQIRGVPAMFINGEHIEHPRDPDEFRDILDSYL